MMHYNSINQLFSSKSGVRYKMGLKCVLFVVKTVTLGDLVAMIVTLTISTSV